MIELLYSLTDWFDWLTYWLTKWLIVEVVKCSIGGNNGGVNYELYDH